MGGFSSSLILTRLTNAEPEATAPWHQTRNHPVQIVLPRLLKNWLRTSAFLILLAAVILFGTIFAAKFYRLPLSSYFLAAVLVALSCAIALHARFLILLRRDNQKTANTLHATGSEFKIHSRSDAILILDDQGAHRSQPGRLRFLARNRNNSLDIHLASFTRTPGASLKVGLAFWGRNISGGAPRIREAMARRCLSITQPPRTFLVDTSSSSATSRRK